MAATIRDVAKRAGVSVSTVSVVINGGKYVSPALRHRVESAVRELAYVPNPLGRALSLKRTCTLAYIIPTIANQFFPPMIQAVEETANKHGYGVIVCSNEGGTERRMRCQSFLQNTHVDGILVSFSAHLPTEAQLHAFIQRGIPVVRLAGPRCQSTLDCVVSNDDVGMQQLTTHLIELGHERIAYVGRRNSQSSAAKLAGIRQALHAVGRSIAPEMIAYIPGFSLDDAFAAAKALLMKEPRPTAFLAYNDSYAIGIIQACHELGLRVPEDVTVTGYDDTLGQYTLPRLTSVRVPAEAMGRLATELLINRIRGKSLDAPQLITFTPEVVVRESSCVPATAKAGR